MGEHQLELHIFYVLDRKFSSGLRVVHKCVFPGFCYRRKGVVQGFMLAPVLLFSKMVSLCMANYLIWCIKVNIWKVHNRVCHSRWFWKCLWNLCSMSSSCLKIFYDLSSEVNPKGTTTLCPILPANWSDLPCVSGTFLLTQSYNWLLNEITARLAECNHPSPEWKNKGLRR